MKIDRKTLNLVVELPREGEPSVLSHSTPLPAEILERYHALAGPTMNAILTRGYGYFGPRYAASVLREVAMEAAQLSPGADPRTQDAANARAKERVDAFFSEIRRRTHILCLTEKGWEMLPLSDAVKADHIDDEECSQIENAIVFFTFGSRSWVKAQREAVSGGLVMFNARIESSSCTELMHSLETSTQTASSGANPDASPRSSTGSPVAASKPTPGAPPSHGVAQRPIEIVS